MKYDMFYNGQVIDWPGHGKFRASSGMAGHQNPDEFCAGESGPLPPGYYKVFLADRGQAQDDGTQHCNLKPAWGTQTIARGAAAGACELYWANWGWHRARMEPADEATRTRCTPARGGFYLHDSIKGYSHGCIEVEGRIFPLLSTYARSSHKQLMILRIKYVPGRPTYGGTYVPQ